MSEVSAGSLGAGTYSVLSLLGGEEGELAGEALAPSLLRIERPAGSWLAQFGCEARFGTLERRPDDLTFEPIDELAEMVERFPELEPALIATTCVERDAATESAGEVSAEVAERLLDGDSVTVELVSEGVALRSDGGTSSIVIRTAAPERPFEPRTLAAGLRENVGERPSDTISATRPLTLIDDEAALDAWLADYALTRAELAVAPDFETGTLIALDAGFFGDPDVPPLITFDETLVEDERATLTVSLEQPYGCGASLFDADPGPLTPVGPYLLLEIPEKVDIVVERDRTRLGPDGTRVFCDD